MTHQNKQNKMKRIGLLLIISILSMYAVAQTESGKFYLISKVGMAVATTSSDQTKSKVGWHTGVGVEYGLDRKLSLTSGAFFSMEGGSIKHTDRKLFSDYVQIPLLLNYYPIEGFAVKTGVQVGFQVFCKEHIYGDYVKIDYPKNKVAFSIPIGISYEWRHFVAEACYHIGLTDMIDYPLASSQSRAFTFTLGYKIPL